MPQTFHSVGTVVRILRTVKTEEGTLRIWVQGMRRAAIGEFLQTHPYLLGQVHALEEKVRAGVELEALQRNVSQQFLQVAEGSDHVSDPVRSMVAVCMPQIMQPNVRDARRLTEC